MKRPCLGIGSDACPNLVDRAGARCPTCQAASDRQRGTTTERGYGSAWQNKSRQAIAAHIERHGLTCLGWGTGIHTVRRGELVTDHDRGVMCRGCNSRKAATVDKQRARQRSSSDGGVAVESCGVVFS